MCTVLLPPSGYPIAVKYIIPYRIISYHIISYHIIYRIISYHIISYYISYHIISCIISYHIISYHIIYHTIYHITGSPYGEELLALLPTSKLEDDSFSVVHNLFSIFSHITPISENHSSIRNWRTSHDVMTRTQLLNTAQKQHNYTEYI